MKITTIGLDLAKSIFQIHRVDATGQVNVREQAGQKTASDQCHRANLPLAMREPSTEDIIGPVGCFGRPPLNFWRSNSTTLQARCSS
jgi:hypothetical protein